MSYLCDEINYEIMLHHVIDGYIDDISVGFDITHTHTRLSIYAMNSIFFVDIFQSSYHHLFEFHQQINKFTN